MKKLAILIFFILVIRVGSLRAQELDCDVRFTQGSVEALNPEARDNLADFKEQVKQYLNNQRWTKVDYGEMKIKCQMEISLQGQGSNNATHYVAQAVILTARPVNKANKTTAVMRVKDPTWEFDYLRGQPLTRDEFRYEALQSFLDYYAYMIIGYDADTYKVGDGTAYFEKAFEIVNRAKSSGAGSKGWESQTDNSYSRGKLVEELLNPKFAEIRLAWYRYYFKGLDFLAQKPEKGRKTILASMKTISEVVQQLNQQSLIANLFFETKASEIGEIFKNAPEPGMLPLLIQYDPQHRQQYETAFNSH